MLARRKNFIGLGRCIPLLLAMIACPVPSLADSTLTQSSCLYVPVADETAAETGLYWKSFQTEERVSGASAPASHELKPRSLFQIYWQTAPINWSVPYRLKTFITIRMNLDDAWKPSSGDPIDKNKKWYKFKPYLVRFDAPETLLSDAMYALYKEFRPSPGGVWESRPHLFPHTELDRETDVARDFRSDEFLALEKEDFSRFFDFLDSLNNSDVVNLSGHGAKKCRFGIDFFNLPPDVFGLVPEDRDRVEANNLGLPDTKKLVAHLKIDAKYDDLLGKIINTASIHTRDHTR